MRKRLHTIWSSALRGGLAGGAVGGGLIFPLEFFAQVDSMRISLRPADIFANFSFAWLLYFGFTALAGALVLALIAAVLLLFKRYDDRVIRLLVYFIVAVAVARVLLHSLFTLADLNGGLLRWTTFALKPAIVGLAAWLVWRQTAILDRVREFINVVASVAGIVAVGTFLTSVFPSLSSSAKSPLNGKHSRVILITIDTLAANRMSLYGYSRDTTPSLNKFAHEAVVFERHYANGNYTTPSVESILSGTRPWVHRTFQLNSRPVKRIAESGLIPTLKRAGYRTLTVATNPYAMPGLHGVGPWVDRERLGKVGFADYEFLNRFPRFGSVFFFPTIHRIQSAYRKVAYAKHTANTHFDPEDAFSAARALLLAEVPDPGPELLWVHLFPPHDPYAPPPPFLRSFDNSNNAVAVKDSLAPIAFDARTVPSFPGALSGRYDEAILYVDHHVGQFLNWLKEKGYYDDSLVIVTSDHGESFAHAYGRHAGPMLYEDLIRVPLMVKRPHQRTGTRVANTVTEHADIFPTVLDCLGLSLPTHLEGRSLKAALEGRSMEQRPVYAMNFEQNKVAGPIQTGTVALLEGRYKYVRYLGQIHYPHMPKLQDSLHDVVSDPTEDHNLAPTMPEMAARMRSLVDAAVSAHSVPGN